jgi:hypothetical protein
MSMSRSTMSYFVAHPHSLATRYVQMCGFDTLSRLMSLRTNTRPSSLVTYLTGKRTIILTIFPYTIHFVAVRYVRYRPSGPCPLISSTICSSLSFKRYPCTTQICFHLETPTILQTSQILYMISRPGLHGCSTPPLILARILLVRSR